MRHFLAGSTFLCCLCVSTANAGEKLQAVGKAVHTSSPDEEAHACRKKRTKDCGCEEEDVAGQLVGEMLGALLSSCFSSSSADAARDTSSTGSRQASEWEASFLRYPYAQGYPGYLWFEDGPHDLSPFFGYQPAHDYPLFSGGGRVSIENGNDFDGLNRLGGQVVLDTSSRLGVQSNWNWYHEKFRHLQSDSAFLGDFNVTYRFFQTKRLQMYAGIGGRIFADGCGTDGGLNFLGGADCFPVEPVVISWQIDGGSLGSTRVWHTRATLGVLLQRWELFAGYDFVRISNISLQGPLAGLRVWF